MFPPYTGLSLFDAAVVLGVGERDGADAYVHTDVEDVAAAALDSRAAQRELMRRRIAASRGEGPPVTEDDVLATPEAAVSAMMAAFSTST